MQGSVRFEGQDKVDAQLKKLSESKKLFDSVIQEVALKSRDRLVNTTPYDTHRTRKKWDRPRKRSDSVYVNTNTMTSQDGKHAIVNIINDGRGIVRPIKAKKLYIPISRRAKYKVLGAPIPEKYVYGKDYVFAKQAKAFKGTNFVDKEIDLAKKEIANKIKEKIKAL